LYSVICVVASVGTSSAPMRVKDSAELLLGAGGDGDGTRLEPRVLTRRFFVGDGSVTCAVTIALGEEDTTGVVEVVLAGTDEELVSTKLLRTSSLRHERKML
jgi:hypothetical protein